jgi:PsbP-like protein
MLKYLEPVRINLSKVSKKSDGNYISVIAVFLVAIVIVSTILLYGPSFQIQQSIAQPTSTAATTSGNNFLTYQNSTFGIKIQYPSNWAKEENNNASDSSSKDLVVTFSSPTDDTVELFVNAADKSITLQNDASSTVNDYQNSFKNFKLVQLDTNATLAGNSHPAYKLIFTGIDPQDNSSFKSMETTSIIANKIYTISYTSGLDKYSTYLPTVQKMIDSFGISPPAQISK